MLVVASVVSVPEEAEVFGGGGFPFTEFFSEVEGFGMGVLPLPALTGPLSEEVEGLGIAGLLVPGFPGPLPEAIEVFGLPLVPALGLTKPLSVEVVAFGLPVWPFLVLAGPLPDGVDGGFGGRALSVAEVVEAGAPSSMGR